MERIKRISQFVLCISSILFVTTFLDVLYPKGNQAEQAYQNLINKYIEIGNDSYISEIDLQGIITQGEFKSNITRDDVKNRVYTLFTTKKNMKYIFDEEKLQNISEQFALMYDQQQMNANNTAYTSVMNPLRIGIGVLIVIAGVTLYVSFNKEKQEKDMV